MLKTAYQLGVQVALNEAGLLKEAGSLSELAKRIGGGIASGARKVVSSPTGRGALIGAGLGAGTGLATSAAVDKDHMLRDVLLGALAGGGLGAGAGALSGRTGKTVAAVLPDAASSAPFTLNDPTRAVTERLLAANRARAMSTREYATQAVLEALSDGGGYFRR